MAGDSLILKANEPGQFYGFLVAPPSLAASQNLVACAIRIKFTDAGGSCNLPLSKDKLVISVRDLGVAGSVAPSTQPLTTCTFTGLAEPITELTGLYHRVEAAENAVCERIAEMLRLQRQTGFILEVSSGQLAIEEVLLTLVFQPSE